MSPVVGRKDRNRVLMSYYNASQRLSLAGFECDRAWRDIDWLWRNKKQSFDAWSRRDRSWVWSMDKFGGKGKCWNFGRRRR